MRGMKYSGTRCYRKRINFGVETVTASSPHPTVDYFPETAFTVKTPARVFFFVLCWNFLVITWCLC